MNINISNIPAGITTYELSASAERLKLPDFFSGEAVAQVSLEKTAWQIVAAINVHADASFDCDRCTEHFVQRIEVSYTTVYTWTEPEGGIEEGEDVYVLGDGQKVIDLSETVHEYLVLGVPIKHLCREDCLGLCAVCGTNLNERLCGCRPDEGDSRWSALQKLASRTEPHS
jgi:uncharacterized protein